MSNTHSQNGSFVGLSLSTEETALEAAIRAAGKVLLQYWPGGRRSEEQDLGVQKKDDGSVVTQADFSSNEIVVSALRRLYSADGILSEELPLDEELKQKSRIWIIDPLDGTQSFVDGNDDFSILVALTVHHAASFGMMHFPARKQFAFAKSGLGAFLNGAPLKVSSSRTLRAEKVYCRNFTSKNSIVVYPRWMDSGCAFLSVASGAFDGLIIKIVSHREWDLAAPAIVVTESGGRVSDEHGNDVSFGPGSLNRKNQAGEEIALPYRYFVASNGIAHEELLSLIPKD